MRQIYDRPLTAFLII